ncbi:3-deoxy-D-manno-octulosonic acid transferase [Shewanella mangrovi]|uniref:3-deoxy-D-manno-octulosonic acid transferase n=1 Tax=Shewanella mangrovi TaxID=1515746 RepID=A0A094JAI1_9GAMM|nr:lipid IV(A) 3-deoxy-D-manno-octulosonic acid transferase [Shewanella mangrovi]KFZ36247.1 3-deoxy-D-manno-octulosonic acid transferase [Shewanella mangrovi]
MNRICYSFLLYLLTPILLIYLTIRAIKSADYRGRWAERFGLTRLQRSDVLIHSVSMGETQAAIPFIKKIKQQYPQLSITVTTTSPTGSKLVTKAFGDSVQHCYLPFDLPLCIKRFLRQLQPNLLIVMETELWPNLLHYSKQRGANIMLANARLSAKSALGYEKWSKLSGPMLKQLDLIAVQTPEEAQRFIALGVPQPRVHICGSLKFDLTLDAAQLAPYQALKQQWQRSVVWVAGSVHPGEFAAVLECHQQILQRWPDALLIMVPRHPEQFDNAATAINDAGFECVRRSAQQPVIKKTQVLLGDTMGEMLGWYACGDLAFVGGSLIVMGGHNPLEPAALGLPILQGPNYRDFLEISTILQEAGAMQIVADGDAMARAAINLLSDVEQKSAAGHAGLNVVEINRGTLARQFAVAAPLLNQITHE